MSKEVQVVIRCDKCGGDDAESVMEVNSKGKPVEIDLDTPCKAEYEELKRQAALVLAPFTNLIDEKGLPPEKASKLKPPRAASTKKSGERVCLMCEVAKASDTGILGHMVKDHGLPKSMPEIFGNQCPLDGESYPRLAQHVAQGHKEFTHVSQAFAWAKENGDPYKVVASRIAELQKAAKAA